MKVQNFLVAQVVAPSTLNSPPSSHVVGSLDVSTAAIAIGSVILAWLCSELKAKGASADAETALIKSLQNELADKDEEIDKQRVFIWKLEKEIRILRQTIEYSGPIGEPDQITK